MIFENNSYSEIFYHLENNFIIVYSKSNLVINYKNYENSCILYVNKEQYNIHNMKISMMDKIDETKYILIF